MKILGIDYAMDGMAVFSDGSSNYHKQKRKVALCHEKIRNQRKD